MTLQDNKAVASRLATSALGIAAKRRGDDVVIAQNVDLRVAPGESIAIVGESGSGKSLTARAILDLLPEGVRRSGEVTIGGESLICLTQRSRHRVRGAELAFVMQDPFTMLNPLERCGIQVTEALRDAAGHKLSKSARHAEAVSRLAEVGITDPSVIDKFPHQLSGGMRQRVAIAAAIAEKPKVLIADEPTTALDVTTQHEILQLLGRLRDTHQLSLVLITHDLRLAFSLCDRVYVMYAGAIVEEGDARTIAESPRHPYTAGLLQADPPIDRRVHRLVAIKGCVAAPGEHPSGCSFAPRCHWATPECSETVPSLVDVGPDQRARCIRVEAIAADLGSLAPQSAPSHTRTATHANTEALVAMRDIRKEFHQRRSGQAPKAAVAGVNLDVFPGESVGLVGESGSGKTTLARMVVGLTRPTSGTVALGGVDISSGHLSRRAWSVVRSTAQMAFQDPQSTLNPARSVSSTLKEALHLAGEPHGRRECEALIELVGLPGKYVQRRPSQLSGGERQRVAIARALARRPRLLVCDEIVSALDVSVQAHILNLLLDLRDQLGLTYLFITHDLAVVRQVTDRIYVLKDGLVVEQGDTAGVLDQPAHEYTRRLIASIPGT